MTRTGPGVTAKTLIAGAPTAKRAPISNTEIGPVASSNWKSGNTRTPIMVQARFRPMSQNEGNMPFRTAGEHVRMGSSCQGKISEVTMSAPSQTPTPLQIGLVLFPRVTQLDFTGPLQVFSSLTGARVHLIWKRIEPVTSDSVLVLTPTTTFADCPQLDVICVPGGFGTDDMINDEEMLAFLRKQAPGAKYITSVCTGSLVLGAAGLLKGYRATTHWTAMDFLSAFGATADQDARLRRPQPRHRRWRHRRDRFCADAGVAAARPERPPRRSSSGSNTTRRRRSIPVHPIPRRRKSSPS